MVDAGCEYCVMEVSSQGLKMDRVAGFTFDIGILPTFLLIILNMVNTKLWKNIYIVKSTLPTMPGWLYQY